MPYKVLLGTISNSHQDWLPYAAGCLISCAIRDLFIKNNYAFLEPAYKAKSEKDPDLWNNLSDTDILGLSCYVWNQVTNDAISKKYKKIRPNGIVLYGGPNIPENKAELNHFSSLRPWVDHLFLGPGEESFINFLKSTNSPKRVYNGQQIKGERAPSPYTDGIFDSILKKTESISASIETNRGCPYSCAFCDWGGQAGSRITRFDRNVVFENISYIIKQNNIKRMEILDANFGIFKQDLEYVKFIVQEKQKFKKDMLLTFAGLAKNGSQYLKDIMAITLDNFPDKYRNVKLSFQTLTPSVLEKINRRNIRSDKIFSITKEIKSTLLNSELIIGLPGETSESFLETLCSHVKMGIDFARSYPLYILPNTPMNQKEYREKFQIKSKKIFVPCDLSHLRQSSLSSASSLEKVKTRIPRADKLQYESFEMIYSCCSYNIDDLVRMYDYWFWFNTFYNAGVARYYIQQSGLTPKEQALCFFDNLDRMPFISGLVQHNRDCVRSTVANPEPETFISNLRDLNWLHKAQGRSTELIRIYWNRRETESELKQLYPDYNTKHFNEFNKQNIFQLLSSFASISKEGVS